MPQDHTFNKVKLLLSQQFVQSPSALQPTIFGGAGQGWFCGSADGGVSKESCANRDG